MPDLSLGLAFGAGLLAIVNPCALGMIPAYLALHATADAGSRRFVNGVVGIVVGFVGVFSAVALAIALFGHILLRAAPLVASAIGLGLLALGVLILSGRRVHLRVPGTPVRAEASISGQVLFGATYALASLGCALPVFLSFAAAALSDREPLALALTVGAFALGAAAMVCALVLLGTASGYIGRALPGAALSRYGSGALLTASGAYLSYLQLGVLLGYPLGIPMVTLPF